MGNPINTSNLYQNTGELKERIAELEAVQKGLQSLRRQEIKNAKALEVAVKKVAVKKVAVGTSEQRDQLEDAAKEAEKIAKNYKKYNESLTENGKKLAALKVAQQKVNQQNKLRRLIKKENG